MNDDKLPWNYQVVFNLPPQFYHTTYTIRTSDPIADVDAKVEKMTEYKDALAVIERIKSL